MAQSTEMQRLIIINMPTIDEQWRLLVDDVEQLQALKVNSVAYAAAKTSFQTGFIAGTLKGVRS